MPRLQEFDASTSLADQMKIDDGPIVLVNHFTADADDHVALVASWARDADFMKSQRGYISTQLHKGIGDSTSFLNYAIWQDVESFRNAFRQPEFQRRLTRYPDSAIARPHLFQKLAVANHCTG